MVVPAPIIRTHRNALLVILWGIILAKCFTLEYLVQLYSVPINSAFYIWSLSLFMAAAATFVFARLTLQENASAMKVTVSSSIWYACAIAVLLTSAAGFTLESINPYQIPTYLALIMGLGYCAHGLIDKNSIYVLSGFGWWVGSAILFRQGSLDSLRIFPLLIVMFSVCPTLLQMYRKSRKIKRAVNHESEAR
jgi:hypothetical protein